MFVRARVRFEPDRACRGVGCDEPLRARLLRWSAAVSVAQPQVHFSVPASSEALFELLEQFRGTVKTVHPRFCSVCLRSVRRFSHSLLITFSLLLVKPAERRTGGEKKRFLIVVGDKADVCEVDDKITGGSRGDEIM